MFWSLILSCSSRAFNCGSLKILHHGPRNIASRGCATFHPSPSLNWVGLSLYDAGVVSVVATGFWYFGPTRHPLRVQSIRQKQTLSVRWKYSSSRRSASMLLDLGRNGLVSMMKYIEFLALHSEPEPVK